jgi:serine/threonine protein kinase/Tfp pilus assembly protein PilF
MIGETISHYRVLSKLGEGGMGVVYEAEDTRLGRLVALKFLPPELAQDRESLERFEREARVASALNHPGICTVFTVEEFDSRYFIVLELLQGVTLAQKLEQSGALELDALLETAIQVAVALEWAHAKGVVHRDLKPANIFINPKGQTKIIDFGLAKIAPSSRPDARTLDFRDRLTRPGTTFGTVAFMSPEHARGELNDARSDLFSFGAVLYQLATGQLPFAGETPALAFDALLHRDARPLREINPRLPAELERIVSKLLEKNRSFRYQSATDLIADLERLKHELDEGGRTRSDPRARSVAVLYLENLSGAKEEEYFRDGVTEDIVTELSKIQGIQVFSRATVLAYRDHPVTPAQIGKELGAAYVLTGSVRRAGTRLRINCQLVDTATGFPLWSERYDRELKDVFEVQDEIARSIAAALRITLTPQEQQALAAKPTENLLAYDLFLRGKSYYRRMTRQDLDFALQMLETAVLLDPEFALGHATIANVCAHVYYNYEHTPSWIERAKAESQRATALHPELPEGRTAAAWILYAEGKYGEAVACAHEALDRRAGCEGAYYILLRALFASGEYDQVLELAETAIASVDDYNIYIPIGNVLKARRDDHLHRQYMTRRIEALERHLRSIPEDARARIHLAGGYAQTGRTDDALREAKFATVLRPDDASLLYNLACVYCMLGQTGEAMEVLRKAWERGWRDVNWTRRDRDLAALDGNEEFERLFPLPA